MQTDMRSRTVALVLACAVLALLPKHAMADVVVLTDGTRFVGVVTSNTPVGVSIRSGGNDWAFWKRDVASVRIDKATRSGAHARNEPRPTEAPPVAPVATTSDAQVVLYGTTWCGYCERARQYFREHQIPFVDRDIEADDDARAEVARKCRESGSRFDGSIPVIDVNGRIIHGFNVSSIEAALREHG